ncbi:TasA family protein [Piscibacillus halophilus]|uniref:TasA family protein n=1 Tax=Piscibacillus halophilus TaxID=571933 RepID=UPI00158E58AD|nr:TasA family protein [Piscibacillus halophilus]
MKKHLRHIFLISKALVIMVMMISSIQYHDKVFADSDNLSISTTPDQVIFDVNNIKPGDWFEREFTVENDGDLDIVYYIDSRMINGSEKLYNHMNLTIKDSSGDVLYNGKLGDYKGLEYRELAIGEKDELMLIAEFPPESGNEYQGLKTNFVIRVNAREEPIDVPEDIENPDEQDREQDDPASGVGDSGGDKDSTDGEQVKGNSALPQTGEQIPYLFYIIGGIFLLSGVTLYLITRRLARDHK